MAGFDAQRDRHDDDQHRAGKLRSPGLHRPSSPLQRGNPAEVTALVSALPGGEGKEGIRLSGLRVLLEALDDLAPGVGNAAQLILGEVCMAVAVGEGYDV